MNTLGDLKKVILESEGKLKIGGLSLSYSGNADSDVDIKLNGNLTAWISSDKEDDLELSGIDLTIKEDISSLKEDLNVLREKIRDLKKGNEEFDETLKKKDDLIGALKIKLKDDNLSLGKVEAYEKLLIGRTLSIGE